jgi:hypothetical protein
LAVACSDDGGDDTEAFCDEAVEVDRQGGGEDLDAEDPEDLALMLDSFARIEPLAPEEVEDDLAAMTSAVERLQAYVVDGDEAAAQSLREEGEDAVRAPFDRFREYLKHECGI